ncbi:MAG: hypothetical protein Q4E69_03075 [Bacilli bacterium]|nr:hypothetical protein [Bacilli bacterium]
MKIVRKIFILLIISILLMPIVTYAVPDAPPGGMGGGPSRGTTSVSYTGATTISSDTTESNKTYSSTTGSQNSLLVSGGTSTLNKCTIEKSGESSGDEADFYGTNAAVLVYNGATLNIKGGSFTTNGSHANAVFAYGTGTININDATINTTSNNSGGVMVTGGGTLNATNCTVKTLGNSSAAIRSDRGGGTLTVEGGTYETNGMGSPAIYSTANITTNNTKLISTSSEGIVVEGANSVTINNTNLTDTNTTLNGNSETYKNIFLYQSMSGDADQGTASFTAKDSTITTNKGDTIFVTNTTATISLENNTIINNDGDLLRIQAGKWGNSGSNGGHVTLNMSNQSVEGNIIVDNISTLNLSLTDGSELFSGINTDNQANNISVNISKDSVIVLNADSYITSLTNEDTTNQNIYLNGHKLYVNGKEVEGNTGTYEKKTTNEDNLVEELPPTNYAIIFTVVGLSLVFVLLVIIVIIIKRKKVNIKQ